MYGDKNAEQPKGRQGRSDQIAAIDQSPGVDCGNDEARRKNQDGGR